MTTLRLGTRASTLARTQSEQVAALVRAQTGREVELVDITTEGGVEHIEALAERYLGGPYPWYGGRDQVRLVLTIAADRVHSMG